MGVTAGTNGLNGAEWSAGDWRVQLVNSSGTVLSTLASSDAPNGWNVTPDDAAMPTILDISAPLEITDFYLQGGYLQNSLYNSGAGYGREDTNTMNAPDYLQSLRYRVQIKSTTAISMRSQEYGNSFGVVSYGPRAVIENEGDDFFNSVDSIAGERRIVSGVSGIGESLVYLTVPAVIVSRAWEVRRGAMYDRTVTRFQDGALIQSGNNTTLQVVDEFEPGDDYDVVLTVTNDFGKEGRAREIIAPQAMAIQYDNRAGTIDIASRRDGYLQVNRHYDFEPPQWNANGPGVIFSQAPVAMLRHGAWRYLAFPSGVLYGTVDNTIDNTVGTGLAKFAHPPYVGDDDRLLGAVVNADGSLFYGVFKDAGGDSFFTRIPFQLWESFPTATATAPTNPAGINRPSVLLQMGQEFLLIGKSTGGLKITGSPDGITWSAGDTYEPRCRLLGAAKNRDGSMAYIFVAVGGVAKRCIAWRGESDWELSEPQDVTGLAEYVTTPAALDFDGVRMFLAFHDAGAVQDGAMQLATSYDCGREWITAT